MPNIHIVGYPLKTARRLRKQIDALMMKHGYGHEAITSIDRKTDTKACASRHKTPHLLVAHTKLREARKVVTILHDALDEDVEILKLAGFLAKRGTSEKN